MFRGFLWPTKNQPPKRIERALRHLRDRIVALDRRMPHIERIGEIANARDAAALSASGLMVQCLE